jgi:hypothetical protein
MSISKKSLILQKTDGRCYYCGKELKLSNLNIDHIFPKLKGGKRNIENLAPVCKSCNSSKGSKTLEEYRSYLCKKKLKNNPLSIPYFSELQISYLKKTYNIKIELPSIKFYFEEIQSINH